jgi:hypothetical protein
MDKLNDPKMVKRVLKYIEKIEKATARVKEFQATPEGREYHRIKAKNYYEANRDEVKAKNRERYALMKDTPEFKAKTKARHLAKTPAKV